MRVDWEEWKRGYRHREFLKESDGKWREYVSRDGELWIRKEDAEESDERIDQAVPTR